LLEREPGAAFGDIGDLAWQRRRILVRQNSRNVLKLPPRIFAQFGTIPKIADNDHPAPLARRIHGKAAQTMEPKASALKTGESRTRPGWLALGRRLRSDVEARKRYSNK
jgi:hypothetical protein